ncbi:MAG: hypothetical protein ACRES9_05385 [Gammaproteobacteria bacterium]
MLLLSTLILAGGLNAGISTAPPASFAAQAEARLNRLTAAAEPALHHKAVTQALAAGNRRLSAELTRALAASRPEAEEELMNSAAHTRHAKATLDRLVAETAQSLHRAAVTQALAAGNRRLHADLARELTASRPAPETRRQVAAESAVRVAVPLSR